MNKAYSKTIPRAWRHIAKVFSALGDEQRQRILLLFRPQEALNIAQIVAVSPLGRTAVTHHLRVLRDAGILTSHKTGKEVYFRIDKDYLLDALTRVRDYIEEQV